MEQNVFFLPHEGLKLAELAEFLGAELVNSDYADVIVRSVAPISGPGRAMSVISCRAAAAMSWRHAKPRR